MGALFNDCDAHTEPLVELTVSFWHFILWRMEAEAEQTQVSEEATKLSVVKYKYGLPVPKNPRKQAIFYNKSLDVEKIRRVKEAIEEGATWRAAAMQAGMYPKEFEYMIQLGRAGHPAYGRLVSELLESRGKLARQMFAKMFDHAMSEEGVSDGTLEKMIKAEERDSWIETAHEGGVNPGATVKVNINVEFGDEREVSHEEILDAEDAEFEEMDE